MNIITLGGDCILTVFDFGTEKPFDFFLFWKKCETKEVYIGNESYLLVLLSKKRFEKNNLREIKRAIRSAKGASKIYIEPFLRIYTGISMDFSEYTTLETANYFFEYFNCAIEKLPRFLAANPKDISVGIVSKESISGNEKKLLKIAQCVGETHIYTADVDGAEKISYAIYDKTGAAVFVNKLHEDRQRITADAVIIFDCSNEIVVKAKLVFNPFEHKIKLIDGREIKSLNVQIPNNIIKLLPAYFEKREVLTVLEEIHGREFIVNFEVRC